MQFFPALVVQKSQASRPNGLFEMMESRSGQDFSDFLSLQMGRSDSTPYGVPGAPQHSPSQAAEGTRGEENPVAEPAARECHAAEGEPVAATPVGPETVDAHAPTRPEDAHMHEDSGEEQARPEKPAGDEVRQEAGAHVEQPAAEDPSGPATDQATGGTPDSPLEEGAESGPAEHAAGEAPAEQAAAEAESVPVASSGETSSTVPSQDAGLFGVVRELLDRIAEASGQPGEGNQKASEVVGRIRELVNEFLQSDPSSRSGLAVALGERIRELKAVLKAESGPGEGNGTGRTAASAASSAARTAAVEKLERVAQRLADMVRPEQAAPVKEPATPRKAVRLQRAAEEGDAPAAAGLKRRGAEASKGTPPKEGALEGGVRVVPSRSGDAEPAAQEPVRESSAGEQGAKASLRSSGTATTDVSRDTPSPRTVKSVAPAVESASASRPKTSETERAHADAEIKTAEAALKASDDVTLAAVGKKAEKAATQGAGDSRVVAPQSRTEQPAPARMQTPDVRDEDGGHARNLHVDAKAEQKQPDARQGFFSAREQGQDGARSSRTQPGKTVPETESLTPGQQQFSPAQAQQRAGNASPRGAEVFRQVENGAFRNLGQGVKQLVIRLDPEELGQVSVILQMKGKEIQAVLRTSNQETSQVLGEQISQLRTQLEAQGLKVGKLEVQTQLADSQTQSQWQGAEQHNRYQENRELAMNASRWRAMGRMESEVVRDVHNVIQRENNSQGGVDIFA